MARVVAAGVPHHITQRGNNRQDVFLLDDDRRFYLETLRERSPRHGVTLLGYCLMANQVHLVAIPERPDSLARALGQSHSRYAQGFNRRYGRTGHLWQNRFYSCPLGRTHLPIHRQIGDRLGEANALLSMGRLARETDDKAQMQASLRQAESIYESIGLKDWARRARELGRATR